MPPDLRTGPSREARSPVATAAPMGLPLSSGSASQRADDDWWRTGVVYQIYPRSFADANADGLGDIPGALEHLDHLNDGTPDSLNVDAIWFSPIYPSPDFDFGYDVGDYLNVDPRFGTLAQFDRLVTSCHERGIRVILDLVLNHSSHRHPWFEASRTSRDNPFADWYIWADSPGRSLTGGRRAPNNWRSFFGGSAWTWEPSRGQFYMHTFLPEQPDLNWRHPAVRAALLDVVRFWLDRGVDGFRLDVFNVFFKDAKLRSNPRRIGGRGWWSWQQHRYDRDQPELEGLLAELRAIVDERPGRMTVGELFDGSIDDAARLYAPHHLAFDFMFMSTPWSAAAFRKVIEAREAAYGPSRWPANALSNHDQPRHASRYDPAGVGGNGVSPAIGDARAKVAATMLLSLRGTPFLYYGEEIATRNLSIPNAVACDPPARRANFLFRWWNRDQCRGPMAWRPESTGGFTTGRPWLPLGADVESRNVAVQARDPDSVLAFYRRLLWLRRSTPALRSGDQTLVESGSEDVLAYIRGSGDHAALVMLNFGEGSPSIRVPAAPGRGLWRVAISTSPRSGEVLGESVLLQPLEALIAVSG